MPARRLLPTDEAVDLLKLVREIAARELAPRAAEHEAAADFPREVFAMLGETALLGLPYPAELGGGGQPYEVYLQVLEEVGAVWASVGVGMSVHVLSCFPLAFYGTAEQRARWLPDLLAGEPARRLLPIGGAGRLGPGGHAHHGPAGRDEYVLNGAKAWTTHGGEADFYLVMARTAGDRTGISSFLVPADTPGLSADPPEHKMGLTGSTTATMLLDVRIPVERRIGDEARGCRSHWPRWTAAGWASRRSPPAWPRGRWTGPSPTPGNWRRSAGRSSTTRAWASLLADMEAAVQAARATYLHAARLRDQGMPFGREASVAKLVATDNAMKVTTDAVQVLGGYGYTTDFPVERYMR